MKSKNWIWLTVALAALAAFGAGIYLLHSGAKTIAPHLTAPPVLGQDKPVQTQSEPVEEHPQEPASGVLQVCALAERLRSVERIAAQTPGVYPTEQTQLLDGGSGLTLGRSSREAPAEVEGAALHFYRSDAAGAYQIAEAGGELRLYGLAGEPLLRTVERFTGESVSAFFIACGSDCLRVEDDGFVTSEANLATRWAEEPETGYWYTVYGGVRRYLNSDGLGEQGKTLWTLDGDVLRGTDYTGDYELYFNGRWMLSSDQAFFLSDGAGHCFNMDETGVLADTEPRTLWMLDGDTGGYFSTYLDGHRYYLSLQDGQPVLGDDPYSDYWQFWDGTVRTYKDGDTYGLNYRAGAWRIDSVTGWQITDGEHYLSAADGQIRSAADAAQAAVWRIEPCPGGAVLSTQDGETGYLGFEEHTLLLLPRLRTVWQQEGDSLRCEGGALEYRNGWTLGAGTSLRFEQVELPVCQLQKLSPQNQSSVTLPAAEPLPLVERSEQIVAPTGLVGCVPIVCDGSLAAGADNFGYLCVGQTPMRLSPLVGVDAGACRTPDAAGELRPAGEVPTLSDYEQNRSLLEAAEGGLWGLRLTGEIRDQTLSVLPLARFGGQNLYDCELPQNAVDLRLAEPGRLGLFTLGAGGFALYGVERDPDDAGRITSVRRIARVFRGRNGNVYDYAEGGLPVREDAELLFDTAWLQHAEENGLCYFEIPLNAGEIALGALPDAEESGIIVGLAVSEQSLKAAPAVGAEGIDLDALSDRAFLSFLRDGANAALLRELLASDEIRAQVVARAGRIAEEAQRSQAAELLDLLAAVPDSPDWRKMPDALFMRWLCDPDNSTQAQSVVEKDLDELEARIAALVSHGDYFRAMERLHELNRR